MPTIDLEEVLDVQTERVAKVETNADGPEMKIAELRQITSLAFALAVRSAKKESGLPELEKMWSRVVELCDLTMGLAKQWIAKTRTPISLADFERFQEAARFRAELYRKPA